MILKKFKSTAISFLVSQQEIVSLFQKFCQLDRNSKGFISADEFLSVPEFAMNPLPQRLLKMVDGLNFKDFVAFLSAFSAKASLHHKIEFIFKLYDVDCNGKVSFNDIIEVLGDSSNSFISDEQREAWRLLSFRSIFRICVACSIFRICVASPIHRYLKTQCDSFSIKYIAYKSSERDTNPCIQLLDASP
ncbi:calcineurin subunit B-like isoform X2 [Cucurbita moschata]|uniref:Calcineurin subunit B-like isoform X2 n=1 Tax=Cucurbita moschata TaxID=3662 RepID=A0A6J1GQD6_CUCMO|nr:calcineurin subunit B-like isoform X2 [Cucurbita moschata]